MANGKNKVLRRICQHIRHAQVASDGGKYIYLISETRGDEAVSHRYDGWRKDAYKAKDNYILLAIKLICQYHIREIRFNVTEDRELDSYLVYFDFKDVNGVREQISFHSYDDRLWRFMEKSRKSSWTGERDGSRRVASLIGKGVSPMD